MYKKNYCSGIVSQLKHCNLLNAGLQVRNLLFDLGKMLNCYCHFQLVVILLCSKTQRTVNYIVELVHKYLK